MQDLGNAIAVDSAGDVYVTGDTTSVDFPTANPLIPSYGGGTSNAFVAELDPTGSTLLYSTYLGGEGFDRGNGIAVDPTGSVYVVGKTNSLMFPITPGAFEDTFRGPEYDAFVTKLGPGGAQLEYSTYLGGDNNDSGIAIAVDANGNAFVTGGTASDDFPVTQSAYQEVNNGYTNAFITELNATGTDVLYSTFLGGSYTDRGDAIAVDANDFVYVAGHTNSPDFPTQNALQPIYGGGPFNGFVAKLNPQASGADSLIYSTFLGGSVSDEALGIAVDGAGDVYVAGETSPRRFPGRECLAADLRRRFLEWLRGGDRQHRYDASVRDVSWRQRRRPRRWAGSGCQRQHLHHGLDHLDGFPTAECHPAKPRRIVECLCGRADARRQHPAVLHVSGRQWSGGRLSEWRQHRRHRRRCRRQRLCHRADDFCGLSDGECAPANLAGYDKCVHRENRQYGAVS